MAEAATVIQLVQFSAAVLGFCYAYIQKAKSAPTEITAIIDETTSLKTVLEQLQTIANNPNDERFVILKSLSRPNGPFAIATSALADLDARMKAMTELSGLKKRLQWPIEARGVEKILERIAALKTDFYLALAGDVGLEVDRIQDAVGDVKVSLEDMKAAEEKRKIIDWIAGPDPAVLYNSAKAKRQPGTCEWLLKSEDFQNWFCKGGQLMWLHGLPGAGKTFLSSATIEHLLEQPLSTEYTIVYYYFDFRDTIRQTCSGLLRSLAHQICSQAKSTPELLLKLHEECRGSTPSNEQLLEALQGLLQLAFRTFVIIDALDECPGSEDGERGDVLDVLKQLKTLEAHNLSIFVASRPEADIKEKMKDICDFDTDIQSASVDEDIRQYVRSCLSNKSDKLNRWPQNIKDEIEEKLMQKAGGMFRWAACQLGELRKCLKPARVRAELDNLPKTLDETYARILANVPDMYHAELRTALIFLTFSTRPMTVQEVAEATAINIQEHSFSTEDRFGHPYDLLEVCSSLVSLSELPTDANSPFYKEGYIYSQRLYNKKNIRILQFAHFSVKEYLLAERTQKTILDVFIINEALSHSQITAACLTYLLDFNGGERLVNRDFEEFPLLPYSALHWSAHLALSKATESAAIDPLLLKLFDPAENHLLNLLNLYNPQHWQKELAMGATRRSTMDFRPPLYYASFYGLVPVVESLLQTLTNDDVRLDVLNSSLAGAATGGHANIIEMLLVAGADPNASLCGDVLCNAAKAGSPSAVKSLIQAGASKHASESYEGDALHAACVEGQPEVVHLLLDYGFDIHKRCQRYGVPLSAALRRDNEALVKLLIEKGANVNFPVEGYWNPLAIAAEHSSLALVKYLLSAGATIGPKTNPLAEAAKRGDLEMVKLLLRHGADINYASDGFYGTALKGAIQSRNSELLDFVLQAGADIDQRGGSEMYPVDMAIYAGSIAAAEKLLDLGAAFSDCAMEEALDSSQKYHLVKILLLQGADANAEHER
jgi:ankyrin repeat protein/archaellum biogenesis ATPase FlaH